jgi:hypothetical protein
MQHGSDSEVDGLAIFDRTLFQAPRLPFEDTWRDTRDLDYCFQNPDEDEGEKLNLMPVLMDYASVAMDVGRSDGLSALNYA